MKNLFLRLLAIGMIVGFSANIMAQGNATATATATATIVTPITIASDIQMNFGNIAVNSTGGTVVLLPAGSTTPTGGVTLPPTNLGTISAATFNVSGEKGYTYAIGLQADGYVINDGNSNTMTLNSFTSTPATTGVLAEGAQTIKVGATLIVGASQAAGEYTNATGFEVSVDYN